MNKTAHIAPHYTRYGRNGYDVFAVGFATFFAQTMKIAKEWCNANGLDAIRL